MNCPKCNGDLSVCELVKRCVPPGKPTEHWNNPNSPYRAKWLREAGVIQRGYTPRRELPRSLPCIHEGPVVSACSRGEEKWHVRECPIHGHCVRESGRAVAAHLCATCEQYTLPESAKPTGLVAKFDEHNLYPEFPGKRFNSSLIAFEGGYLMCWRSGWAGSELFLSKLDSEFKPTGFHKKLNLHHTEANYGREDPRFFWFRGQLHLMFIGVVGPQVILHTSVLYARLSASLDVEAVFFPKIPNRNAWEKNHAYFEHDGQIHAVYSFAPHQIIRIDGEHVERAYSTTTPAPWAPRTEIRGGAAPVLIDDEWWMWAHSREEGRNGVRTYCLALYTFANYPPFRVQRIIPEPLMWADATTKPFDQYAAVVFPCGAVKKDDQWVVSMGIHDRWTELHRFSHRDLERRMIRIAPPKYWRMRDHDDPGIFSSVCGQDEYELHRLDLKKAAVLDVGGHVGSFTYLALEKGAELVHTYEPYQPSREMLEWNVGRDPAVTIFPEAIGAADGAGRLPPAELVEHSGGWSVIPDTDGAIPIVGLDTAIERLSKESATGRVNLLKIDCEGGEWPGLARSTKLHLVDAIVGEWHRYQWDGKRWGPEDLAGILKPFGFTVHYSRADQGWGPFRAVREQR